MFEQTVVRGAGFAAADDARETFAFCWSSRSAHWRSRSAAKELNATAFIQCLLIARQRITGRDTSCRQLRERGATVLDVDIGELKPALDLESHAVASIAISTTLSVSHLRRPPRFACRFCYRIERALG
jgi:hypothetical protein